MALISVMKSATYSCQLFGQRILAILSFSYSATLCIGIIPCTGISRASSGHGSSNTMMQIVATCEIQRNA